MSRNSAPRSRPGPVSPGEGSRPPAASASESLRLARSQPLATACLALVLASCATNGWVHRDLAGTPSPTGCDAWLEIGGTFARTNDVHYTLINRSTRGPCLATRVVVQFSARVRPEAFRVSAPPGWIAFDAPCHTGGVCGFGWRTRHGVPPGEQRSGFGLAYDPADAPLPREWWVDVGRTRLRMPIGTVGG